MLKVGTASLVLEMIEAGVPFRDFSWTIRSGPSGGQPRPDRSASGSAGRRPAGHAPDIQRRYYAGRSTPAGPGPNTQIDQVVDLWGRQLDAVESQDFAKVDTEIDWVIKRKLFQRYQDRYSMELSDPRSANWTWPITTSNAVAGCSICCSARDWPPGSPPTRRSRPPSTPAADHPGQAARRIHRRRTGSRPRLHRGLGAPQAQRPGSAHRALQGSVPLGRRAGQAAHRQHVSTVAAARASPKVERDEPRHRAPVDAQLSDRRPHPAPTSPATATRRRANLLPDVRARQERTAGSGHPAGNRPGQRLGEPTEGLPDQTHRYELPPVEPDAGRRAVGGGHPAVGVAGAWSPPPRARC